MTAESFKQQYFSLHPKLYRVAFALLKNTDNAEDILQDAYCKLWDNREQLAEIKQPEAYCVTLVKNLCLDFLRSPKAAYNENVEDYDLPEDETPVEKLENKESLQKVKNLIQQLPKKQRQVLELRSYADCSFEEIESITGESSANVRVLLSRARNTLKIKLIS